MQTPRAELLVYLDQLCSALVARDDNEVRRLLEHVLAGTLPREVREEVRAILALPRQSFRAPVKTFWYSYVTEHVLDSSPRAP